MNEGFCKIELHITYVAKNGARLFVESIWIDANGLTPTVWVEYIYQTPNGKEGLEKNSMEVFVKMLREK